MKIIPLVTGAIVALAYLPAYAQLAPSTGSGQAYPAKPVRLVVPSAPGGGTDITARVMAPKLGEYLGQQVVVENRAGAGTMIGGELVARAAPDGYTLLMGISTLAINPAMYKKVPYDALKDFAPISQAVSLPNILVVHPSLPAKTVKELVAFGRARPGQIQFASAGVGTNPHLTAELFLSMTGLKMLHIPYKGSGAAMADMLSGQVTFYAPNLFLSLPHIRAGKLHVLGVTTAQRSPIAPDIPTIAESGLPGYEVSTWFGIFVPGATPRATVGQLNQALAQIVKSRDMQERLAKDGLTAVASTPQQFADEVARDTDKYSKVIRALGIKAE